MEKHYLDGGHRRAIVLLSAAAFTSAASSRICDAMLPELTQVFSMSTSQVSCVISAYAIAYGVMQAFFGVLGDRIGKFRLIAFCTLASTIGTLTAAFSGSLAWLVSARIATGVTTAGVIPLSAAWIGDTVSYEHRQTTLASFLTGQIIGMIGGQFIGGFFVDQLSWRWAFIFMALTYLVIGWLVLIESRINPCTYPIPATEASAPIGGLAQISYVLRKPWPKVVLTAVLLEGMLTFGPVAFMPTYLHEKFSLSITMTGVLMAAFGAGGIAYIIFSRRLLRYLGEAGLVGIGGCLLAIAWLILAIAQHWVWIPLAIFLAGLGYYKLHNTLQTHASQMAPAVRGTAMSLFSSAFFLGQSLGVFFGARVIDTFGSLVLLFGAAPLALLLSSTLVLLLSRQTRQPIQSLEN